MEPVSVNGDGSVVFEFANLRHRTRDVGVQESIKVLVPADKLLRVQVVSARTGRIARDSGKKLKKLLSSIR